MCRHNGIFSGELNAMNKKGGFKVWIEYAQFGEVMRSEGLRNACINAAQKIANKNGAFKVVGYTGKGRTGADVIDEGFEYDNKLLKAVR